MVSIIQIIVCVALIAVIMLQSRGDTSAGGFGGGTQSYRSKKGLEKFLFYIVKYNKFTIFIFFKKSVRAYNDWSQG